MLRFAIEATCLADRRPTGIGRFAQGLIEGLTSVEGAGSDYRVTALYRTSRWRRRRQIETVAGRSSRQSWRGNGWPFLKPYALVHATADLLPHWSGPLKVSTIHDVYAALGINFEDAAARERTIGQYRDIAARSDFIVFISEQSRQDFLRLIGFDAVRTAITSPGVSARFGPQQEPTLQAVRSRYGLQQPYLLFVGLTNPNKNLPRLLAAYAQSSARHEQMLLVVGQVAGEQRAMLDARLRELGISDRIQFTGYIDDADIPALYTGASAFLFPSLYEGFGLPILEAMACGTPVLTSRTTACPEAAGGHAVLVDPESVDDITQGIDAALQMSPAARAAARDYAQSCTWQRTAQQTLAAYHRVLELGRR